MAGLFDDLIPKDNGKGISFDDLIPPNQFDQKYARMSHAQMADAYHTVPNGPEEQYLRTKLSRPLTGETPDQTQQRLGGAPMAGPSPWMSAGMGAADTMTFGFGDEINAGLRAATGQNYNDELEKNRYTMKVLQQDNPKSYLAGQAAGAVVPALATMGASAPGAGGSLGGTMARGAATGFGQGAVYGFGSGEDGFQNRAINAGENAVPGAIIGGTMPVVGSAVGATWRGLMNAMTNRGIDGKAANMIVSQLEAAGHTPDSAAAYLQKLGPDAITADVVPSFAAQTSKATNEAQAKLSAAIGGRDGAASGRVGNTLDNTFGQFQDPYSFRADIKTGKAQINPHYDVAIANHNTMLPGSLAELDPKLANMSANMSAGNRSAMAAHVAEIDDALSSATPQQQARRLLDLRHRLDEQIIYDPRQAATLSVADRASQGVNKQARAMVDGILKNNVSGIAEADAAHAPLSQQQAAFDYGRKQMYQGGTGAITQAENNARLLQMTDPERLAVANGARATLEQKLANQNADPGHSIDNILSRDWNMPKTEQLVGKPAAQKLANALQAEDTYTQTSRLVNPTIGTKTPVTVSNANPYSPKNTGDSFLTDFYHSVVGGNAVGGPTGAIAGGATAIGKRIAKAILGPDIDPAIANEVAQKLSVSGSARDKLLQVLQGIHEKNTAIGTQAVNISAASKAIIGPTLQVGARDAVPYVHNRLFGVTQNGQ